MVREDMNHSVAVSFTTWANSTLRRQCEAKEKFQVRKKIICRSNLKRHWNNEEIASSLWVLIKKINIIQAPRNDD